MTLNRRDYLLPKSGIFSDDAGNIELTCTPKTMNVRNITAQMANFSLVDGGNQKTINNMSDSSIIGAA